MIDLVGFGGGLAAVALTLLIQYLLRPVAHRWNLLDVPKGRKDHAHPTPIIGGLAMAVGVLVVSWPVLGEMDSEFLAFGLGSGLLIAVGLLDDKYDLPWWLRLGVQTLAALIMATMGGVRVENLGPVLGLGDMTLGLFSVPFTVFATVGVINAINMVDGADGLAGSLVLTALLMLYAASLYSGNTLMAERLMIIAGAVAAFLWFNLRFPWQQRAQLFMGNAGSAFLGFVIAWASFRLTQTPSHPVSPVLALWLLPIPVMDCLVLVVRRLRAGHSPFRADQNHVHHLFREAGIRPMRTVAILCLFSALCGLAAGQALRMDIPEPLLLIAFLGLCVGWYWLTSSRQRGVNFIRRLGGQPLALAGLQTPPAQAQGTAAHDAELDQAVNAPVSGDARQDRSASEKADQAA